MQLSILVVEDNRENLELLSYLLRAFGYTVLTAEDGELGLEIARRELPDLILTDLQMPRIDGYELVKAIRADRRTAGLTVVAVTAYAMRGDRDLVMAAGFDGYITKPIVPEEFGSQIASFFNSKRPPRETIRQFPASESHESQGADRLNRDPQIARILIVDNSPVNLEVMRSSLEPAGYEVIVAHSAAEALELARRSSPDLILSDLHMPGMDGYSFLKAVKAEPALRDTPIALISSTVWRETDPGNALALGACRFILRPIEPDALLREVSACLADRTVT